MRPPSERVLVVMAALAIGCTPAPLETSCMGLEATPDAACNNEGLVCDYAGTECQTCRCNGKTFDCQTSANCLPAVCPAAAALTPGGACETEHGGSTLRCTTSFFACGGSCTCSGVWNCTEQPCTDAGASDATQLLDGASE